MSRPAEVGPAPAAPVVVLDRPAAGGLFAAARKTLLTASRQWWVRALFALVAALAVVVTLRGRMPAVADILAALRDTDPRWFAAAVVLQVLSQAAFAWQQRVMLSAFGVRMSPPVAMSIALARSAISLAFPAGGAVSAAYAVRQYRRRGATSGGAATTMLLSGAASVGGLLLAYAAVAGSSHPAAAVVTVALVLAVVPLLVVAARTRPGRAIRSDRRAGDGRIGRSVRRLLREGRAVRGRHLAVTVGFAVLNWLLDLACLVAAARGCGLSMPVAHLATVYLAVQVVRQIPITPGGFGLIEAGLLAGLAAAGAPHAAAAAAVLVYRLASCWLVLPVGLISHLTLRFAAARPAV